MQRKHKKVVAVLAVTAAMMGIGFFGQTEITTAAENETTETANETTTTKTTEATVETSEESAATTESSEVTQTTESVAPSESSESVADISESDPLTKLQRSLLALTNSAAGDAALAARIAALEAEGWQENLKNEPAYLLLSNGDKLRYYFGGKQDIGQDYNGNAPGKLISQASYNLKIPNVDYIKIDGTKETIMPHLYMNASGSPASVYTSQGLIVATQSTNNTTPSSSIMYNPNTADFRILEKRDGNGNVLKKLLYISKYHDTIYNPELLVEETMTPLLSRGLIKMDQEVTNVSSQTYPNFMLGYAEDIMLVTDLVPRYALGLGSKGKERGFYIEYTDKKDGDTYRLSYYLTDQDYPNLRQPDNWHSGYWTRYIATWKPGDTSSGSNRALDTFFNKTKTYNDGYGSYIYKAFDYIESTGDEAKTWPEDTEISPFGYDSAVAYKSVEASFAPGSTTGFSWLLGIAEDVSAPEVALDAGITINQKTQGTITGQWKDDNVSTVDLYYKINGGSPIKHSTENNNVTGTWKDFSMEISAEAQGMHLGENTIEVYAINEDGVQSSTVFTTIYVNSQAVVTYQDESGTALTPPAGSPTVFNGKAGASYSFTTPNIPTYEFKEVIGATASPSGDQISGTYGEANTTVTIIYKIAQVTMTVHYAMKVPNDTVPLKDIDAGNAPIGNETEAVRKGRPISDYLDKYKKAMKGYTIDPIQDETGNVPNTDFDVTLYYEGILSLENCPDEVDFGTKKLITMSTVDIQPLSSLSVDILDTVESPAGWNLQLRVKDQLKTSSDELFKGAIKFRTLENAEIVLNENSQTIALKEEDKIGYDTITWDKSKEGLYLTQEPGNLAKQYEGSLEWTLTNGK